MIREYLKARKELPFPIVFSKEKISELDRCTVCGRYFVVDKTTKYNKCSNCQSFNN